MPRDKNPSSRQFGSGQSQPHIGVPRSQSGTQGYGGQPVIVIAHSMGGLAVRETLGRAIFSPGPKSSSHGGSKKGRNKGKGSR
jgi:hypothetical protein